LVQQFFAFGSSISPKKTPKPNLRLFHPDQFRTQDLSPDQFRTLDIAQDPDLDQDSDLSPDQIRTLDISPDQAPYTKKDLDLDIDTAVFRIRFIDDS
jgi:hypothetical protein